jgi:hypothetical protein
MKNIIKSVLNSISCLQKLESIPSIPIVNNKYYQKIKSISTDQKQNKYNIWKNIICFILFIFKLYCHKDKNLKYFIKDSCYSIIKGMNFNLGIYQFVLFSKINYDDIIDNIDIINKKTKTKIKNIISEILSNDCLQNTLFDMYMVIFKFDQDYHSIKKYFGVKNYDIFPSFIMKNELNDKFINTLFKKQSKSNHYANKIIPFFRGSGLEFKIDPKSSVYNIIKSSKLLISDNSDKIIIHNNSDLTCSIPLTTSSSTSISTTSKSTSTSSSSTSTSNKSSKSSKSSKSGKSKFNSCSDKFNEYSDDYESDNKLFIETESGGIG